MAGTSGQHRIQAQQGKSTEEKTAFIKTGFVLILIISGLLSSLVKLGREPERQKIFIVKLSGNVQNPKLCTFNHIPEVEEAIECAGGLVVPVEAEDIHLCNGCEIQIPYPGEKPVIRKMHVLLLHALGEKKCLKDSSLKELEDLPGIGPHKARLIASYIASGGYERNAPWPRGIGPKTRETLWRYFEDCRERR